MWYGKLTLEQFRKILTDSISHLDFRDLWMITWIDRIAISDDGTPYFKASVHRVRSEKVSDFSIDLLDLKRPRWITIPLRLLRIFPVGTLFNQGMAMFKSHHSFIQSYTLDINTSRELEDTTLGQWKHGKELIDLMSWHKLNGYNAETNKKFGRNSKIVVYRNFKRPGAYFDFILFAKTELARFYWFPSNRLFKALMSGKSASRNLKNDLYVPESACVKLFEGKEYHYIILRDSMHLHDVDFIARLAFSSEALSSANRIYQSVINTNLEVGNKGALQLDCSFPFLADTSLTVYGYTVKLSGCDVLIVTEIKQCYGPWPFGPLKYDRETPRNQTDPSLDKEGNKRIYNDNYKGESEDEDDDEDEDKIEATVLRNLPDTKSEPDFDHNRKNNNLLRNMRLTLRGSRFPTMPKDKERLERFKVVPPRNDKIVDRTVIDNISTNENTMCGGSSTNVDVVSKEESVQVRPVDMNEYLNKVCEYLKSKGADSHYVRVIDDDDYSSTDWYQSEQISLQIRLTEETIISYYLIYVIIQGIEFVLCEMEKGLGTSIKIITKHRLNSDGSTRFIGSDIALIVEAIKTNFATLGPLKGTAEVNTGFDVIRLYHVKDATHIQLAERILGRIGYKDTGI